MRYAVALDPLADRVLMDDETLGLVIDYTDEYLVPIEPDEADVVVYFIDGEYRAASLWELLDFTVH